MSAWTDRSREEACLFNPSFLGLLVWSSVAGYHEATELGLPFELAFLALPLSLHKPTREALPRATRTSLAAWLESNAVFRVGFRERASALAPFVREAILFALTHNLVAAGERGQLRPFPRPRTLSRYLDQSTAEVHDCAKKAEFIGRWFGTAGTSTTIMTLWGVAP
jgi:Family of unknown function (DUF6521)